LHGGTASVSASFYMWRRALLAAQPGAVAPGVGQFARVHVIKSRPGKRDEPAPTSVPPLMPQPQPTGLIEIVLPDGTTLRVDGHVDPRALRRVLSVLRS
jgi:hypothetical protein